MIKLLACLMVLPSYLKLPSRGHNPFGYTKNLDLREKSVEHLTLVTAALPS